MTEISADNTNQERVFRVEQHIIKKDNQYYQIFEDFTHKAKNLYNHANYLVRQEFINTGKWLRYQKLDKLLKYVREGVRAAEQIFDQKDSRTKKKYVMHYVGRILEQMSIPLTEEELELLVEAAVRTMNAEECLILSAEEYDDDPDDADETEPSVADK